MPPRKRNQSSGSFIRDLLTFDRLITGQVLHLVYWAGLALILLFAVGVVGGAIGIATRETSPLMGVLLALPGAVAGLLISAVLVLVWRAFCEFCGAVFRIAEDLRAIRQSQGIPPADEGR